MVRIINYKEREAQEGEIFYVLILQGGIEMIKSQNTQRFYATAKRASIPSTFDEATCKGLIGTEMPGLITKVDTDPYEYTIQETGEIIELSHRYEYSPEDEEPKVPTSELSNSTLKDFIKEDEKFEFSRNGVE
ncbi:hypothetical protein [Gillisia sp. JM1]|uniref:hypothetical protein n=1 Tax=Gillisia sp. JM1 TaxID=1283286 RepID=UPI00040AF3CE|nr:hypothetical protein [Gillisia sp. JM1]